MLSSAQVGKTFHTIDQLPEVVHKEHGEWVEEAVRASALPHFDPVRRLHRVLIGSPLLLLLVIAALVITFAVLAFRALLLRTGIHGINGKYASLGCGMLNALFISVMNVIYVKLATWLNDHENWRTESDYQVLT